MSALPYLVVVGGSYVGVNTAQQLANAFSKQFRVILIEKNSHFLHLFAFPRFAVTSDVDTHKAFIPYVGTFANCPVNSGTVIQAEVLALGDRIVRLDRQISLDGLITNNIPYAYLVIATGTKLPPPSSLPGMGKIEGATYLRKHAQQVQQSSHITVIGGGAVGVQMATDIKELYPEKSITLVHSRQTLMSQFDSRLSQIVIARCLELGIKLRLGSRVKIPTHGYPTNGSPFTVDLEDGSKILTDFAIICSGQTPQSGLIRRLSPQSVDERGFIKTLKSLQIDDARHPNIFAVGDVAATSAHKAAKPGNKQAATVVKNIRHLLENEPVEAYVNTDNPGIHLTLGITKSVAFGNPTSGFSEPFIKHRDDGRLDMNIDGVWARKGGGNDYYL